LQVGDSLGGATRLTHLDLGRNNLASAAGLQSCSRLESLILYENQLESFAPAVLMPRAALLRHLYLNGK